MTQLIRSRITTQIVWLLIPELSSQAWYFLASNYWEQISHGCCTVSRVGTVGIPPNAPRSDLPISAHPSLTSGGFLLTEERLWDFLFFLSFFFLLCHCKTRGILVPQSGIEPVPSTMESQPLDLQGNQDFLTWRDLEVSGGFSSGWPLALDHLVQECESPAPMPPGANPEV